METLIALIQIAATMGITVSVQPPAEAYFQCTAFREAPYTIMVCQPYANEAVLHIHKD